MDEDLLETSQPKATIIPTLSVSQIAKGTTSALHPSALDTSRHILHGPSPQPPRQRGILISEPSSTIRPALGESPPAGKGKKPLLPKPRCGAEFTHPDDGYETSDSDEDSFQNALNAILYMDKGRGSTSGAGPVDQPNTNPPPNADPNQPVDSDEESVVNPPSPFHFESAQDSPSENELIADLIDNIIDEEPLSVRAKRLQVQKEKKKNLQPNTPPLKSNKQAYKKQPKSVRFSPAQEIRTTPHRRKSVSPKRGGQPSNFNPPSTKKHQPRQHRPRSRTKKPVSSPPTCSVDPPIIDISATSTECVDTPKVDLETYYRNYTRSVPRRSVRIQANSTQTPIMKKAQKRKANGKGP